MQGLVARKQSRYAIAVALIGFAGLSALFAGPARGGAPIDLSVVPATADPAGFADFVDLDSSTYTAVEAALTGASTATVPLDVPGLPASLDFAGELDLDAAKAALSISTIAVTGSSVFGADSPFAALNVQLLLVADWDETDPADAVPDVALLVKSDGISLGSLNPAFTAVEGAIPDLVTPTLAFSPSAFTLDPAALPSAAASFLGSSSLDLGAAANVFGAVDLGSHPALAAAAEFLGTSASSLPLGGQLAQSAQLLTDPSLADAVDLGGLSVTVRPDDFPNAPSWMTGRDAEFTIGLGAGNVPFISLTDTATTTFGGATNTFTRTVNLSAAKQFSATIDAVDPFTTPFGLDWLVLSDVGLAVAYDGSTFSGSVAATVDVPGLDAASDPTVTIAIESDGETTAGSVAVAGTLTLQDVVDWFTSSGGPFSGSGIDSAALGAVSLDQIVFSFSTNGGDLSLSLFASSTIGPLAADLLLGLEKPSGQDAQLLLGLSVTQADGQCQDCIRLGTAISGLNGTLAADLELPALNFVVVQGLPTNTDGKVDLDPSQFGTASEEFFGRVYDTLPATIEVDLGLTLSANLALDPLGPEVRNALGYAPGSEVVLTGSLGVNLGVFDGSPGAKLTGLSLEAELPTITGPSGLPDWLTFPPTTLTFGVAYDAIEDTFSFTADTTMATDLFGGSRDIVVTAEFATGPGFTTVMLTADMGAWNQPFGISWLDLTTVKLLLGFETSQGSSTLTASLQAGFTVAGDKDFEIDLEGELGGAAPSATLTARSLDPISLRDLMQAILPASTYNSIEPGIPDHIEDASIDSTTIVLAVEGSDVSFAANADFSFKLFNDPAEDPIAFGLLLRLDSSGTFTVGLRPNDDLTLAQLVPGDPPVDFALVGPGARFGLVVSTDALANVASDDLDEPSRDFFSQLYGEDPANPGPFTVDLPSGFSLLGNVTLPEDLAAFVTESLGLKPGVQLSGTLPIFGSGPIDLRLALEADPAKLPQWMDSASLSLVLRANPADQSLEFGMVGTLAVKVKAGMPPDIADALDLAGVDVVRADPVAPGASCVNGTSPLPVEEPVSGADPEVAGAPLETNYYCFDILEFQVDATLKVTATPTPKVEVVLGGQVQSLAGPWNPFGIEWLGVSSLRVEIGIGVETGPPPGVTISFGFLGDVLLGPPGPQQKDLLFAAKVGAKVVPNPPWIIPQFEGIRMETERGLELNDIVAMANGVRQVAGEDPLSIDGVLPNVAVRNLEFALSPSGVPSLCIPRGLVISGDLYIDAPPAPALEYSLCDDGQPMPPPVGERCLDIDGCLASINLSVGSDGIFALAQLGAFDIGPLQWGGAELDIALSLPDTHLRIAGDASIVVATETVASGELAVELRPLSFDFFGRMQIFDFSALVDGSASLDLFNDDDPGLTLHVLLAAAEAETGEPNFNSVVSAIATPVLSTIRTAVLVVDGVIEDAATLDPAVIIRNLPTRLRQAGVDVPTWLTELIDAIDPVLEALPTSFVGDVMNVVLNGATLDIPGVEIDEIRTCWVSSSGAGQFIPGYVKSGKCYKSYWDRRSGHWVSTCLGTRQDGKCWALGLTPTTIGIPGICNTVFPAATFPDLRNAQGKCEFSKLISGVVVPLFDDAIQLVFPGAPSVNELRTELRQTLLNAQKMFEFGCFEFNLDLTQSSQSFDVGLEALIYDTDLAFMLGWDFAVPPAANLQNLLQGIFGSFTGNPPDVCQGLNTDVFESTGGGGFEPPEDPAQLGGTLAASSVNEGSTATFNGTFNKATGEARSIEVNWGDGASTTVAVAAGATSFSATHVYADDDPTSTSTDQKTVTVSDPASPTSSITRAIEVRNVAPIVDTLSLAPAGVDEAGSLQLSGTFSDPGTLDTHSVEITWGDGATTNLSLPAGARSFSTSHVYADDNPTGTPSDTAAIRVVVMDDDSGDGSGSINATVNNVTPTNLNLAPQENPETGLDTVFEGTLVQYVASFEDVGSADTHVVTVDWGDGTPNDVVGLGLGQRVFGISHTYVDDDPSGTPQDDYIVTVTVEDDDTGSATATFTVTVVNVAPNLAVGDTGTGVILQGTPETSDDIIDEDGTINLEAFFVDPGVLDEHTVVVDWGDTNTTTITLPVGHREFELTHRYLDDDPTATPQDQYTISVTVDDDDSGSATTTITHIVRDVAPVVTVDTATQEVQYSDPMAAVTVTATDVERDVLTAEVWWSGNSVDGPVPESAGLPSWLTFSGDGNCVIPSGDNRRECTWTLSSIVNPATGIYTDAAPGTYSVRVRVTDDDTLYSEETIEIVVLPEDAVPWYVGPTYAATVSAADGTTSVALRANVRDITTGVDSSNPHWDPYPGDIRRADVTFYDSETGADLCTAEVDLLFSGDTNIGTAECSVLFDIGNAEAVPFEISVRVGHWYTNEHFPEETVLMVAKPLDDFMTGGGYLVLTDSAGVYAGDDGSKANFGFNVKFSVNKNKVNLQGRVTIIVRQDGRIYKIKSNAIQSAGLNVPGQDPPFLGQFESKANLADVTDPDNPVALGGNLKLQMNLVDGGNGPEMDSIQFRLIEEKNGRDQLLLFASNWDGARTVLQQLGGGNVTIHGPSGPDGASGGPH